MQHRTVDVGDVALAVAEAGDGGRPLLLVHGFTGAKEDFSGWLGRLAAAGWHAVAPDLRGHGRSSKPADEDAYSLGTFADDVLALADAFGWSRFTLLGHSMGGMVAQLVALAAPERLTGLVLMDTGHGPVDTLEPAMVDAAVTFVRSNGIDALADVLAGRQNPLDTPANQRLIASDPGYAEFGDRKLRATSPALYAAMALALVRADDRLVDLRTLPASLPVLVIVGDQDAPFLPASQRMVDAIAGATLVTVRDAGHSPQFENPDAWWTALAAFLGAIPG